MKVKKWWYSSTTPRFRDSIKLYYDIDLGVISKLVKDAGIEHLLTSETRVFWTILSYHRQILQVEFINDDEIFYTANYQYDVR